MVSVGALGGASGNQYKGVGIRSFLRALEEVHGGATIELTLERADAECAASIREGRVLPPGWYPIECLRSLHAAAQEATGAGPELSRRLGNAAMRADFRGVYRIFLVVLSPESLVSKSARVFSTYYTRGAMHVSEKARGFVRVSFADCVGFDRNLWSDVVGSSEAGLELCGAKDIRFETLRGGGDGDDFFEIEVRWR